MSFSGHYRLIESSSVPKLINHFGQIIFLSFPQAVLCIPSHIWLREIMLYFQCKTCPYLVFKSYVLVTFDLYL